MRGAARTPRSVWMVFALACLSQPQATEATTYRMGRIESNLYLADGKLFFCQPDESLTVLNATTGQVLVRDSKAKCEGTFERRGGGIVLSAHWGRHRMIDLPATLKHGRLRTSWEMVCDSGEFLDEQIVCAHLTEHIVELRALSDGSVRWRYDAGGEVTDIVVAKGRVALQSGQYRLVHAIAVLDLASGRQLARHSITPVPSRILRDRVRKRQAVSMGVEVANAVTISDIDNPSLSLERFDGETVVLEGLSEWCEDDLRRSLRLDSSRQGFSATDECVSRTPGTPAPPRSPACPAGSLCELSQLNETSGTGAGARVTISGGSHGATLLEFRGTGKAWTVYHRNPRYSDLARFAERDGHLFLESVGARVGSLECLDLATGMPLWLYVYPSEPVMTSTSVWAPLLPDRRDALEAARTLWQEVRADPPKGASRVPPTANLRDVGALEALPGNPRVVFDSAIGRNP